MVRTWNILTSQEEGNGRQLTFDWLVVRHEERKSHEHEQGIDAGDGKL